MAHAAARLGRVAQSLETAVMPGQVIQGHAKYESGVRTAMCGSTGRGSGRNASTATREVALDMTQQRRYHGARRKRMPHLPH